MGNPKNGKWSRDYVAKDVNVILILSTPSDVSSCGHLNQHFLPKNNRILWIHEFSPSFNASATSVSF